MVFDPVVGIIAYVGSHAAEYFMVVYVQLPRRHPDASTDGGAVVGQVVRSRIGRTGFLAGYAVAAVGAVAGTAALGYPWYTIFILVAGGLHLFYDGLIWKLRGNDVARGFGIETVAAQPST